MKIGVALGAGSAKGLAHIGALQALEENGIKPDIIVGTSIGAVIGGAYASGMGLEEIERVALSIKRGTVKKILPHRLSLRSLVSQERVKTFFKNTFKDKKIEELPLPFGCIAADIFTGEEVRLTKGPLVEAMLASSAIPGFFPVVEAQDKFLTDGGLVNPIPVSLAKGLGADFVIGVNVITKERRNLRPATKDNEDESFVERMKRALRRFIEGEQDTPPNMIVAFLSAIDIMEEQILYSKLRLNPPDIFIHIDTSGFSWKEYYRARELIKKGREVSLKIMDYIKYMVDSFK